MLHKTVEEQHSARWAKSRLQQEHACGPQNSHHGCPGLLRLAPCLHLHTAVTYRAGLEQQPGSRGVNIRPRLFNKMLTSISDPHPIPLSGQFKGISKKQCSDEAVFHAPDVPYSLSWAGRSHGLVHSFVTVGAFLAFQRKVCMHATAPAR